VDLVGDGLILARVGARADYEEIRKARDFTQVQNLNIVGFLVLGGADGGLPAGAFGNNGGLRDVGQSRFLLSDTTSLLPSNVLQLT
jgi:hypothetical protein